MLIRQSINFAIHLAAGAAFGALAIVALRAACRSRKAGGTHLESTQPPVPPPAVADGPA